jgi:hypothetical protein
MKEIRSYNEIALREDGILHWPFDDHLTSISIIADAAGNKVSELSRLLFTRQALGGCVSGRAARQPASVSPGSARRLGYTVMGPGFLCALGVLCGEKVVLTSFSDSLLVHLV